MSSYFLLALFCFVPYAMCMANRNRAVVVAAFDSAEVIQDVCDALRCSRRTVYVLAERYGLSVPCGRRGGRRVGRSWGLRGLDMIK